MKNKLAAILEVLGVFVTGVVAAQLAARALGVRAGSLRSAEAGTAPDYLALAGTSAANLLLRYGIILALAFAIGWWHRRRTLRAYGVTRGGLSIGSTIAIAVVMFSAGGLLPRAILFLKDRVPLGRGPQHWETLSAAPYSLEFWVYMAVASFGLVPIVEELFFRAYVQTRLAEDFGAPAAIVMTALLFTLSHRQYFIASGVGIGMMLSLLIGALIGGWARHRYGTIVPGVLAHAIGNLPVRGWVQAILLAAMLAAVILARRAIAAHAKQMLALLASRTILPAAALAVIVVVAVLSIALLARDALPYIGIAVLLAGLALESHGKRDLAT